MIRLLCLSSVLTICYGKEIVYYIAIDEIDWPYKHADQRWVSFIAEPPHPLYCYYRPNLDFASIIQASYWVGGFPNLGDLQYFIFTFNMFCLEDYYVYFFSIMDTISWNEDPVIDK